MSILGVRGGRRRFIRGMSFFARCGFLGGGESTRLLLIDVELQGLRG